MQMCPAGPEAELDRYIGYWEPYATSHQAFDRDIACRKRSETQRWLCATA